MFFVSLIVLVLSVEATAQLGVYYEKLDDPTLPTWSRIVAACIMAVAGMIYLLSAQTAGLAGTLLVLFYVSPVLIALAGVLGGVIGYKTATYRIEART
jgi:hypothetical protein